MSDLDKLAPALVAALAELTDPRKDSKATVPTKTGGQYQYTYLSLPSLLDHVRPVLAKHHLAVVQMASRTEQGAAVVTMLVHESGQTLTSPPLELRATGLAQEMGSAITYARRYSLAAMLGLAGSDDDDGHAAHYALPQVQRTQARASDRDQWSTPPPPPLTEDIHASPPGTYPTDQQLSSSQRGKMYALLNQLGVPKDQQKAYVHRVLAAKRPGLAIDDDYHLTKADGSLVIDELVTATREVTP